ncbi:MAG: phosphoribosylglycinamide formyltransferase [Planctomycetes bacterium]|nr:phosphoribosylglycinamide formyltransferase [Planctomycetota bacterium]
MSPPTLPTELLRMVVLISGGGTTLKNLNEQIAAGRLKARVDLVISSTPTARGLQHAVAVGAPSQVFGAGDYATPEAYSDAVFAAIRAVNPHVVVMAGFLKFVPIPDDFFGRVINIHPGLIPAFCGLGMYGHHVHQAVLDYGAKISGCTVHFVDNQYDHGPIILQHVVPVVEGDTADTLAARVFEAECEAYPEALRLLAAGRLRVDGRVVRVAP